MKIVELGGIEQDLILHGRSAEAGIIGNAGNALVSAFNDPLLVGVQLLRGAVQAFNDVAIDEATGAEERGHAGRDALGELRVAEALEDHLASKIGINAFVK